MSGSEAFPKRWCGLIVSGRYMSVACTVGIMSLRLIVQLFDDEQGLEKHQSGTNIHLFKVHVCIISNHVVLTNGGGRGDGSLGLMLKGRDPERLWKKRMKIKSMCHLFLI